MGSATSELKPTYEVIDCESQNYETIVKECLDKGVLFEDPLFPADDNSIHHGAHESDLKSLEFVWKRPRELVREPKFFVNSASRFDIKQGQLSDCWFLCTCASLAERKEQFERVVDPKQSFIENYAGVFRFRFWRFGRWVDVVVDDRLPTVNGTLVFVTSTNENEFWSSLLEKAFAKLHGCYHSVEWGFVNDSLVDVTGGIAVQIDGARIRRKGKETRLYRELQKAWNRNALICCAALKTYKTQIQGGHAYSITDVKEVLGNQLIRVRNPYGFMEWKGQWSDKCKEWEKVPEEFRGELLRDKNDGEYWMEIRQFLKFFEEVNVCYLDPNDQTTKEETFKLIQHQGEWSVGDTAQGPYIENENFYKNPQYRVQLKDADADGLCTVLVFLLQKTKRATEHVTVADEIGYYIFKVADDAPDGQLPQSFFANNDPVKRNFSYARQVCSLYSLDPGNYCIVPTGQQDQQCEYLLRIYSEHAKED